MKIIGIDPGSAKAGYGVIEISDIGTRLLDAGLLDIYLEKNGKLFSLYKSFIKKIEAHKPDLIGIERLFFMRNIKSGIEVAQARGIFLLCAQEKNIPVKEFTPMQIKQGIAGHGRADKKAMEEAVTRILGLPSIKADDDVFDAIAIALMAGFSANK
jgi:crossover junction endodeoxyribonuclease RuvC